VNTIAMPLDRQTASPWWHFFLDGCCHMYVCTFAPLLSWCERYVQNYVFASCACGRGQYFFGGKGMFLCFHVLTNCACIHGLTSDNTGNVLTNPHQRFFTYLFWPIANPETHYKLQYLLTFFRSDLMFCGLTTNTKTQHKPWPIATITHLSPALSLPTIFILDDDTRR
jgi:hypothetical protein